MVGSSLCSLLKKLDVEVLSPTRSDLDLLSYTDVVDWVSEKKPELIFHAAAKVGGIVANKENPADFIRENLTSQVNVIDAAYRAGCRNLIFVGTNCCYPADKQEILDEEMLLTGAPDLAVRSYAVSKIAGIQMCRAYNKQYGTNYISVIPPNLYGVGDNYDPVNGHIIAGLIQRAHESKLNSSDFVVWGDGTAKRELLYVDDLAAAILHLATINPKYDLYNVGAGSDFYVGEIARLVAEAVGYTGEIKFDSTKPNGAMRKLLDSTRINEEGWSPCVTPKEGLLKSYNDYLNRVDAS